MNPIGKAYLFDYGDTVIQVRYESESRLSWEQIKGPDAGLRAQEEYHCALIRPGAYFIWWQERDSSVVTQVVDFENGRVFTTWISAEKQIASFTGAVSVQES